MQELSGISLEKINILCYNFLIIRTERNTDMTIRRFLPFLLAAGMLFSLAAIPQRASALIETDKTIVAFGDSITAAGTWFADAEKTYNITVVNKGVGGWNSADGRNAFASALALKPDVLFLSFGMNDSARDMAKYVPLEKYRENMRYMIEKAGAAGARVILVIENPIGEDDYYTRHDRNVFEPFGGINAFYLQYVEAARELAKDCGVVVMDMHRIFSEDGRSMDVLLADGVHPSAQGYALYASALCDALLRLDLGDVNGDGRIDALDYMLIKRHVIGSFVVDARKDYADVNRSGSIDALDYMMVKRHVIGSFTIDRNPA